MSKIKLIIVEDKEDIECAEVNVSAMIEGDEFEFLLDTGAGTSSIRNSEFTLNYPIIKTKASTGVFSATQEKVIRIPSLRIGPIRKENVEFTRVDMENGKPNLIGMNVLKDYAFHFDFLYQAVDVNPDDARYIRDCNELYCDDKYHPYMTVELEDTEISVVWDSGASITVVDQQLIKDHPTSFTHIGESSGTDANGNSMLTPLYNMTGMIIDGYLFPAHHVAAVAFSQMNTTVERKMDMILGYSSFRFADWWIDFPAKKWKITKFRGKVKI
jgi:hypothetical protein